MMPFDALRMRNPGTSANPTGSFFFNAPTGYMELASAPVTAVPCTIACWVNPTGNDTEAFAAVGNSAGSSRVQLDRRNAPLNFGAQAVNSGATTASSLVGLYTSGAWNHGAAVFASATSRTAYINGVAGSTNTTNIAITGLNSVTLGARYSGGTLGAFLDGYLAHVAIWDIALTGTDIANLAAGDNPQSISLANLVFYAPLTGGVAKDIISNTNLTLGAGVSSQVTGPTVDPYP